MSRRLKLFVRGCGVCEVLYIGIPLRHCVFQDGEEDGVHRDSDETRGPMKTNRPPVNLDGGVSVGAVEVPHGGAVKLQIPVLARIVM
jgi:hypothetical protein